MKGDMVYAVHSSHPNLKVLGLVGWHFDGVGVSNFLNLREFTLRAEDDDGDADMGEVRAVLDRNHDTLHHLTLGAYLMRHHSWDDAFRSATIQRLTHLDLVDTRISHFVLTRIALAPNLKSLTLHGTFERPNAASVVFGSDQELDGRHSLWPKLEAFRFIMVGHDDEMVLFQSVVSFLHGRTKVRRLDLGDCPWDLVKKLLLTLTGLRVLRIRIPKLNEQIARDFVGIVPSNMLAIHLSVVVSDRSIVSSILAFFCVYRKVYLTWLLFVIRILTPHGSIDSSHFLCSTWRQPPSGGHNPTRTGTTKHGPEKRNRYLRF